MYSARIIVLFLLISLPICSMEIDTEDSQKKEIDTAPQIVTDESNIPLLLTLCLQKIDLLTKDKKWHNHILTKLTEDTQEKLQNHLREKFDLVIAKTFLDHQFKMPYTTDSYNIENAPSLTDVPQKNIYWKKQKSYIGFVSIYSKFNNELTHIREYRGCHTVNKKKFYEFNKRKFYIQDNKFIDIIPIIDLQPAPHQNRVEKHNTDLSRFNFLVQQSFDMPLADLLIMNSSSDEENQKLCEKFFKKWQRQYSASTKKQKTNNTTSSARPTKKQKIK